MIDRNEIPNFNASDVCEGDQEYPPQSGLDRYKKDELIEITHQWCDIVEEKIARIRGHLKSETVSAAQALWYARIFGKYAGLLPTGPAQIAAPQVNADVPKSNINDFNPDWACRPGCVAEEALREMLATKKFNAEPVKGKEYEAGNWSTRTHEAMLRDQPQVNAERVDLEALLTDATKSWVHLDQVSGARQMLMYIDKHCNITRKVGG